MVRLNRKLPEVDFDKGIVLHESAKRESHISPTALVACLAIIVIAILTKYLH